MSVTKAFKRGLLVVFFLLLYLITSVPVGLFLYSIKSNANIDIFSHTGFHSYMGCLRQESYLARIKKKEDKA